MTRLRGLGSLTLGMGTLGVAIAAIEHLTRDRTAAAPPVGGRVPVVPPPPPPGIPSAASPPENRGQPAPPAPASAAARKTVLLLIRAMIAAAAADGEIKRQERKAILARLSEAELTAEEKEFLERELAAAPSLEQLAVQVDSVELAGQVYSASLLAIEVDSQAERDYLARLGRRLSLDEKTFREAQPATGQGA
ncbi:MAG: DUF533 domain-containing protein [Acidobacteriota bacterium]